MLSYLQKMKLFSGLVSVKPDICQMHKNAVLDEAWLGEFFFTEYSFCVECELSYELGNR